MDKRNSLIARLQKYIPTSKAKEVYALIRKKGIVSKAALLEQTQIPVTTMTRIVEELLTAGLIREAGEGESTGGRRPILYQINPSFGYVFGLDISRAYSKLMLFDLQLRKITSVEWKMSSQMTPETLINLVTRAVNEILQQHQIAKDSVIGIGIGAVGPLDRVSGTIIKPLYFPAEGWVNVPLCAELEKRVALPVLLDNGANAALVGEYGIDHLPSYEHLLYVHSGVGLRSAIMSGGRVLYGAVDTEGSIGRMIIQADEASSQNNAKNHGCLESYFSFHALEREAQKLLKQGRKSLLTEMVRNSEQVAIQHLQAAISQNDPLTIEIFTQAAVYFGIGLANMLHILHPEKVILGGPLLTGNGVIFDIAVQTAREHSGNVPAYLVEFSKGKLADDAIAVGAAGMVINHLTEEKMSIRTSIT